MIILELIFGDVFEDELLISRAGQRGKYWKRNSGNGYLDMLTSQDTLDMDSLLFPVRFFG
jgi:hypothetical protein